MSLFLTLSIAVMFQIQEPYSPLPSMSDDKVRIENRQNWIGELLNDSQGGGRASGASTTYERRVPGCNGYPKLSMGCDGLRSLPAPECEHGEFVFDPATVYVRSRATNALLSQHQTRGYCPGESAEPMSSTQIVFTAADFQELPLVGSGISIEPDHEEYIIRLPVIVVTDPSPQVLETDVLGTQILVRATPETYTWEWGDKGEPTVTADPGKSYPEHTVFHEYVTLGAFTITLTTTWTGEYSIDGGSTWQPVNGTAETTDTAEPITIGERVPLLTG
ncbi:hypothetical protein Jden_1619 [Jonesia denitrificans DSM 20603]|uniref:PKD domain-containing protein n=1 Tax=Jonesia denitrificans (strain ATCC 14870 / DSM 20603 / BCRC 15368 / CIP 55.134 / JCM 11481 / NBRC 15587 / NCTC 10816 / Prevot 55134) TaxID=471856 RepID=C7R5J4_JONDD|nr:hypothetical protein Jden_1619 [Jonesia denitrificans DSM 20603]SQH21506.1 Uncharacterised protein [Jonesia denitrificans]